MTATSNVLSAPLSMTAAETAVPARALAVRGLTHAYGGAPAVDNVSFEVAAGEVVALLGPSGCGKSTVLRAIAGLVRPKQGAILLGGTDIGPVPANARRIGMVFQSYALFPHMTVAENVAYPLACQGLPRAERRRKVTDLLALVRLSEYAKRLPREMSGGQQQRVAVARALAADPALLLLDEPFGALDRALRLDLQIELIRLQRSVGITTLIVTHDQEEAQTLASRLVLMNRGRIEQIGSPSDIYDAPRTLFANRFVGHTSQFAGTVIEDGTTGKAAVRLSTGDVLVFHRPLHFIKGARVVVTVRPEHVAVANQATPGALQARLKVTVPLGPHLFHDLELADGTPLKAMQDRARDAAVVRHSETLFAGIDTDRCHVFAADDEAPIQPNSPTPSTPYGASP